MTTVPFDGLAVLFRSVPAELPPDEPATVRFILSLRSGERLQTGNLRLVTEPTLGGERALPPKNFNADDALQRYLLRPGGPEEILFVAPQRSLSAVVVMSGLKRLHERARAVLPEEQVRFVAPEKPLGRSWLVLSFADASQLVACFNGDWAPYLTGSTIFLYSGEERRALLPRRWGRRQWELHRGEPALRRALAGVEADPKRLVAVLRSDPSRCHDVPDFVYQVPAESADQVGQHLRSRLEEAGCRFFELPEEPLVVDPWFWNSELVLPR